MSRLATVEAIKKIILSENLRIMSDSGGLGGSGPGGTTAGLEKSQVTTTTTVIAGLQPSSTATQIAIQKTGGFPMDLASNKVKVATSIPGGSAAIIQQSSNGSQGPTYRTISAPPGPLKIVMPVVNQVIKPIDSNTSVATSTQGSVRTQITAISGRPTISRSITHATYLPRTVAPTTSTIQAQRLTTPTIRAQTPSGSMNLLRGTTVSRNSGGWTGPANFLDQTVMEDQGLD
uniref:Uncharacterized protein n=1 Tax=Megaselia scalaris TaxID=36166 RepID=T1GWR9_MEGSC